MPTFKEYLKDNPDLADDYQKWLKEQGEDTEADWDAFRDSASKAKQKDIPEAAPSDLLDVHAKIVSGTLGDLLGGVTDTVGGVLGGATGKKDDDK
jgi:hypothetical protein